MRQKQTSVNSVCDVGKWTIRPDRRKDDRAALSLGNALYSLEIEVIEGTKCRCHNIGDKFRYPFDYYDICPWLRDSMSGVIRTLEMGETLPWRYTGTPYEKIIDPVNVTTEFVRCPDPTEAGIVVRITRKLLAA